MDGWAMDHEELGHSGFTLFTPTSLAWQFLQQLPISQNETHPNITNKFEKVGPKGKQGPTPPL